MTLTPLPFQTFSFCALSFCVQACSLQSKHTDFFLTIEPHPPSKGLDPWHGTGQKYFRRR